MAKKTKHQKHNSVSRKRNQQRLRKQTKGSRQATSIFGNSWGMSSPRIKPPQPEARPMPSEVVGLIAAVDAKARYTRSKNLDE